MDATTTPLLSILGLTGFYALPPTILTLILYSDKKNKEAFHTSLKHLVDGNAELSPELLQNIPGYRPKREARNDLRTGSLCTASGVGCVLLGLVGFSNMPLIGFGLLLVSTGLGFLVFGFNNKGKEPSDV